MTSFAPDSHLVGRLRASPNFGERRGAPIDMLILHYTGMADADAALTRLCSPESEVSAHYVVFEDGLIVQCVAEKARAWHAGAGCWEDVTDVNSHSIGIEITNPGHDFGYPDFPASQIAAVVALCQDILARHPIPPHRVLAHSDMAPARKSDPGEKFPWKTLHDAGIGLWVEPAAPSASAALVPGAAGDAVSHLQASLARYGYGIEATGRYDGPTETVVRAFQRHFRPARVDGLADQSTLSTLASLLKARTEAVAVSPRPQHS